MQDISKEERIVTRAEIEDRRLIAQHLFDALSAQLSQQIRYFGSTT
jgi:hypothetical protein